ncbi:MAG: hypothetical protein KIG74_02335 [Clostridiaceae bacterium]|nr:hypothetical protein [Clostridiaceae bacterium]
MRTVMESYPATVQEARVTAVAQSLRETGETALADEVIRVWQDAGEENVVYYAKKAAENAAETEDAGYGREGETGGVRVREGRERNDGQSAGGSSGSVEGGTGRTAAADARRNVSAGQSKSRRVAERIARGGGQSTRAATGLSNASANNRYQVYALEEQDMDAEAYIILNDAERNGYRAHLYYKGLYFTLKNGKTVRMDGARAGEDLYIRMDAENFSGEQIANHEMFHALAEGNPGLVDAIMQDIMSEYTEEELEELVQYYTDLYRGVTDDVKKILGELCADAYAGMDRANVETGKQHYARLSEKSGAVRRMTERRTGLRAIGERGVAETRAGPASMQNAPANVIREFEQGDLRSMQYALDADLIFGSFLKDLENQKWLRRATGKNAELITLELPLVMEYGEGDAPVYDPEATTTVQVSQMMLVQMALDLENEANIRHAERGGYTFPNVDAMRKENREAMYTGAKVVKMPREVIARIVQENLSGEGQALSKARLQSRHLLLARLRSKGSSHRISVKRKLLSRI